MRDKLWLRSAVTRSNNFDLIRLFAALQVVVWHSVVHMNLSMPEWVPRLLDHFPGVPIFFFLSGMLVTYSLATSTSVRSFYMKRIRRVFPALWVSFGLVILLLIAFGKLDVYELKLPAFWFWVATQLSFLQFYNPDFFRSFGTGVTNGSLWTISIEIGFYFILPYLVHLACRIAGNRSPRRALEDLLLPLIILSYLLYAYLFTLGNLAGSVPRPPLWVRLLNQTFLPHFWFFGLGMLAYLRYEPIKKALARYSMWLLPLYVAVSYVGDRLGIEKSLVFVFGSRLLLCAAVFAIGACTRPVAARILRGWDLSYGVYVYHMLVINAFVALNWQGSWKNVFLVTAISLVMAAVSWRYIEEPFIRRKNSETEGVKTNRDSVDDLGAQPQSAVDVPSV